MSSGRGRQPRASEAAQRTSRGYGSASSLDKIDETRVEQGLLAGSAGSGEIPLTQLPPLPPRRTGYYTEPICGILMVSGLCILIAAMSFHQAWTSKHLFDVTKICFVLVFVQCMVAMFCVARLILVTPPDEITRSIETCYPIPAEVVAKLRANDESFTMNVDGPAGDRRLGTYCVRCFVWRPPSKSELGKAHHCNICQRCVTGFDHHCSVFGRCIVNGNLTSFYVLIAMLPTGLVTALFPAYAFGGDVF